MSTVKTRKAVITLAQVNSAYERFVTALRSVGYDTSGLAMAIALTGGFVLTGDPTGKLPQTFATKDDAFSTLSLWADVIDTVRLHYAVESEHADSSPEAASDAPSDTQGTQDTAQASEPVSEPVKAARAPRKRAATA